MALSTLKQPTPEVTSPLLSKLVKFSPVPKLSSSSISKISSPSFVLVDKGSLFGIEIEIENMADKVLASHLMNFWMQKGDGSLRNNGVEYISYAMAGHPACYALEEIYKFINSNRGAASARTSVHVHVNMQDQNYNQFLNHIYTYFVFERVLYDFIGNNRDQNNFCIPLYMLPATINNFHKLSLTTEAFRPHCTSWLKYTGFNLKPLVTGFGTIEYRHFSGSTDIRKIMQWINIILSIKKFASLDKPHAEVMQMFRTKSVWHITNEIFGELGLLFQEKPLEELISAGLNDIKCIELIEKSSKQQPSKDSMLHRLSGIIH